MSEAPRRHAAERDEGLIAIQKRESDAHQNKKHYTAGWSSLLRRELNQLVMPFDRSMSVLGVGPSYERYCVPRSINSILYPSGS